MRYPIAQAEATGKKIDISRENKYLSPLGSISLDGTISWRDDFNKHITALG